MRPRPRERLSRERILATALAVADREGLEALTMRRLGRELGVEAMAIYHYLPSKDALLDGLVELLTQEIEVPVVEGDEWRDAIRRILRSYRRVAHAHPQTFSLLVLRPLATPVAIARAEEAVGILRVSGFDDRTSRLAFRTLASYAGGFVLEELTGRPPRITVGDRDAEFEFGLDVLVEGLARTRRAGGARESPRRRQSSTSPARTAASAVGAPETTSRKKRSRPPGAQKK